MKRRQYSDEQILAIAVRIECPVSTNLCGQRSPEPLRSPRPWHPPRLCGPERRARSANVRRRTLRKRSRRATPSHSKGCQRRRNQRVRPPKRFLGVRL
jgi:hypothetical protein